MENAQLNNKNQIRLTVTVPKGYVVSYRGPGKNSNLKGVTKMLKRAEKNNLLLSKELVQNLCTMEANDFKTIKFQFDTMFTSMQGQTFRSVFATGEDIEDEGFTFEDFVEQIQHYFTSYNLGEIDYDVFEIDEKRKVQIQNISKRKDKQDLNCTFRIIDTKSIEDFRNDVKVILESPIVFGEQQVEFIQEANRAEELGEVLSCISNIKVKENLFKLIEITGKEFVKHNDVLKTATDLLRYCYFVSGFEVQNLFTGAKFKLSTADKKIVMGTLGRLARKDLGNLIGDMKPNKSQWLSVATNLHPASAKFNRYERAQEVFDYFRNGGNIKTFNSVTQDLINKEDYRKLVIHLGKRPGELLRSLDMIIRKGDKLARKELVHQIINAKLNPKLTIQVRKWLEYRIENGFDERTFNVKGTPKTVQKSLPALKEKRTKKITKALRVTVIKHLVGKDLFPAPVVVETEQTLLKEGK
jgi:hypothetical protein